MATYIDLYALVNDDTLRQRIAVAIIVAANDIVEALGQTGPYDTVNARLWARYALDRPLDEARKAANLILAKNNEASVAQITGATDVQVQAQVNAVLPYLVAARAAE